MDKKNCTQHNPHLVPVSSKEIAAAYKEQCNMEIDKKKIQLPESIKTFGMHEVPVKLHPQVTGKLHVKVVEA